MKFKSDGCTCSFNLRIRPCCEKHDWMYWRGGRFSSRKRADILFRQCIIRHGKRLGGVYVPFYCMVAWMYYFAVRLFGGRKFDRLRRK